VVVVVVVILLPDFIQLQITPNGNKTANIYVKTVQFISHSHGSVSVVRTTFKVYWKMQTLTLSQPKTPEPIVTKF